MTLEGTAVAEPCQLAEEGELPGTMQPEQSRQKQPPE